MINKKWAEAFLGEYEKLCKKYSLVIMGDLYEAGELELSNMDAENADCRGMDLHHVIELLMKGVRVK